MCHIVLGLKPATSQEEGEIVKGWLDREGRRGLQVGQFWYMISMEWWNSWLDYVGLPRAQDAVSKVFHIFCVCDNNFTFFYFILSLFNKVYLYQEDIFVFCRFYSFLCATCMSQNLLHDQNTKFFIKTNDCKSA